MEITCTPVIDRTYRINRTEPVMLCSDCGAVVPVDTKGEIAQVPAHTRRG